jgi:hypothetical protein
VSKKTNAVSLILPVTVLLLPPVFFIWLVWIGRYLLATVPLLIVCMLSAEPIVSAIERSRLAFSVRRALSYVSLTLIGATWLVYSGWALNDVLAK